MGKALTAAGPLPLVLGYAFWCFVIYFVSDACREMVVRLPLESSFVRFNARWIDEAWGVATAWNVWLGLVSFCKASVPQVYLRATTPEGDELALAFELTAFTAVLDFWKTLNPAIFTSILLVTYGVIHLWDSRFFGRIEVLTTIAVGLLLFTLVAMCGGNPKKDAFGFRYWRDPGPIVAKGEGKQLAAFWKVLLNASFAVAGPDAISIAAGDVRMPRRVLPMAYKSVYFRFLIFFVLGPIALGCLTPSNDAGLLLGQKEGSPGAARSPWVAGIKRLDIPVLPHIVNDLAFYRACKAQGIDRNTLLYKSWGQPYASIFALVVNLILLITNITNGYSVFLKDSWDVADFIYSYFAIFWFIAWYVGWKLWKRTKYISPKDADLFTGMDEIDQEEELEAESHLALTKKEKIMAYIL
ncbi:hypothetical protein RQP46_000286 [Phenoliferia psychrophenolica]